MMISNLYLMIFAVAMAGCVLTTPLVTWVASWVGAIDRPDQFRRIHQGAIPRLGGLALALGVAAGTILTLLHEPFRDRAVGEFGTQHHWSVLVAGLIILVVGFIDDTRSLGPRTKLLGQALAVLALYLGGIRIQSIDVLGLNLDLGFPSAQFSVLGFPDRAGAAQSARHAVLVSGVHERLEFDRRHGRSRFRRRAPGQRHVDAGRDPQRELRSRRHGRRPGGKPRRFLAVQLASGLHFPGRQRCALIGLLIGVIGVEGSMEGPSAISILFPILAMGLPISDTAMAIFRRWVRNLPLSAADRRHVHHLLIGLGLNPRQAALMLYCFSGFLCGAVMLGVALQKRISDAGPGNFRLPGVPAGRDQPPGRADQSARRFAGADEAKATGAAGRQAGLGGHPACRALHDGASGLRDRRRDCP